MGKSESFDEDDYTKVVQEDGGTWMTRDDKEAVGKIGLSPGVYGVSIHLGHLTDATEEVGYYDMYGSSPQGSADDDGTPNPPPALIFYSAGCDEVAAKLIYDEDGRLTLIVNGKVPHNFDRHPHGVYGTGDHVFTFPEEE